MSAYLIWSSLGPNRRRLIRMDFEPDEVEALALLLGPSDRAFDEMMDLVRQARADDERRRA